MEFYLLIASAFFLGSIHAVEPGHGKMIIIAYLVGTGGSIFDALLLSAVATFTHTFSILIIGIAAFFFAEFLPLSAEHYLDAFAGALILGVGLWMFSTLHREESQCHHSHAEGEVKNKGLGQLVMLGISGGIVPCPASFAVLSTAVASGNTMRGIFLILIFSLGMGSVLFVTGILFIKASHLFQKFFHNKKFERKARLVSAYLITILGIGLIMKVLLGFTAL